MRTIVISGFPGVGKSKMAWNNPNYLDLESSAFNKKDPNWSHQYIEKLQEFLEYHDGNYRYIFVSSHSEVRDEMHKRGLPYIVVVPKKNLKEEYITRYLRRGDFMEFIDKVAKNWDDWLDAINSNEQRVLHLGPLEYLSDVI